MKIKKEYLILIFILLAGLIIRIPLFTEKVYVGVDVAKFIRLAKNLLESGNYVFGENFNWGIFFPPGYPSLIGITNLFVNDYFISAKLISLSSSVITSFLFYIIGKELYNEESGLFAAFAYALHPLILKLSILGLSDALFFCFLFLSVYLFIISVRRDDFYIYIVLGISIALSYLIRPEGLLLLLLPFLHFFGLFGNESRLNKRNLFKICVVLSIFILISSPYLLFLKKSTGKFTLTGKTSIMLLIGEMSGDREYREIINIPGNPYDKEAFSLNEEKNQVRGFDKKIRRSIINSIFKNPIDFIERYQKNILQEIKIMIKLLMPIMLPLFLSFFNRDLFKKKIRWIFVLFPLLLFAIYPLFVVVERHVLTITLFLILFSSAGFTNSTAVFSNLVDFYEIKRGRIVSFFGKNIKYIIILMVVFTSVSYSKFTSIGKWPIPIEHVNAGNFLKNNVSSEYEKLNIMSRKIAVSYYSGARFTMLPYANSADVVNFAKLYDVDYIVVDERFLSGWDFYDELIEMDKYSDAVELAYEDNSEKLIKLFKIKE